MSLVRTVARYTGILIVLEILTRITGMILAIAVARSLGSVDYGLFMFAFSFGGLFAMLARLGLDSLVTREVARDHATAGTYLGTILVAETILSSIAMFLMVVTLFVLGYESFRILIVTVASGVVFADSFICLIVCFFRAYQLVKYEALVRTSLRIMNVALSLAVLWLGCGVMGLVIAQLSVFTLVLILSFAIVCRRISKPIVPLRWHPYQALLKAAGPFALSVVFVSIYERMGVILLSFMVGDEATGWYSGAAMFVKIFDFIPMAFTGALLPAMAQLGESSDDAWHDIYRRSMKYLLIVALPIAIGLSMRSSEFVDLLLGQQYRHSASVLSIVVWALMFSFMNHGASNALISIDQEKSYLKIVGLGAGLNVAANWILIPLFGPQGVAVAKVLTECVVLMGQFYLLVLAGRKINLGKVVLKPIFSGAILASTIYLSRGVTLWAVVSLGIFTYIPALLLSQTFDEGEILLMTELVQSGLARLGLRQRVV